MPAENKGVILTVDPVYQAPAYILNENRGHWIEGIWYSNLTFRDVHYYDWPDEAEKEHQEEWSDGSCVECGWYRETDAIHCLYCGRCRRCDKGYPACDCTGFTDDDRYADLTGIETG
ncbi:hypothetical protein ACFC06_00590 [Nocardia sp. NPDC056064]|uniref:hypothetical protein n=1 Tax=Nocardia sp. NPDC056064 TaxID=3345701 RepID=UPI0035DF0D67